MAIFPAKYNGINFSYDFSRESNLFNFDNQRILNVIPVNKNVKYLSFLWNNTGEIATCKLTVISELSNVEFSSSSELIVADGSIFFFEFPFEFLDLNVKNYCKLQINEDIIYSEIFETKSAQFITENEICEIKAYNNDNRHGYLTNAYPAFGFFKFSKLNSDIFINKKTEYEYSYGRRKILSSENNIGKRLTFLNLTMYQQNLLKWLCNSENLFIDGVKYQLISDFTELLSDENSEVKDLRADFVEAEQSFFAIGSQTAPANVFAGEIFMK